MAPRKRKVRTRRRRPPALNLLNTGIDFVKANAALKMFTNVGLWGFAIAPWMRDAPLNPTVDGALDSRELLSLLQGHGMTGGMARYSAAAFEAGRSPSTAGGLSAIFLDNIKKNVIPSTVTIIGADLAKRAIKRLKILQPLNKINRMIGIEKDVRWA